MFQKVCIIGLGLIGGSIALGIKHNRLAEDVSGFDADKKNLNLAYKRGAVNFKAKSVEDAVRGCQLVIIATPVCSIKGILKKISGFIEDGTIVTDAGSVKGEIVAFGEKVINNKGFFVGGHPVAGTENSGFESADRKLFVNHKCVLISETGKLNIATRTIGLFWKRLGCEVVYMTCKDHDEIFAGISHLPHMVAYSLVNTVGKLALHDKRFLDYAAGGFKDFTRIASSNPKMWSDIALMNKSNALKMIKEFEYSLKELKTAIKQGSEDFLITYFNNSKKTRDSVK